MSLLFPDKVTIIPITYSDDVKAVTEGTPIHTKAFIEDDSKLHYSQDGTIIDPNMIICIPDRKVLIKGVLTKVTINKGDFIIITKMHGKVATTDEQVRRRVKLVHRAGHQRSMHLEVIV